MNAKDYQRCAMMKGPELTASQIAALREELLAMQRRTTLHAADGPDSDRLSQREMVYELESSLEKLRVAYEELTTQNETLLETRQELEREHQRYRELFELAPDPYLVTDLRGKILEANVAATETFGTEWQFLKGKPFASYIATESRRNFRTQLELAQDLTGSQEWELRIQPRHRPPFDAALSVALSRDESGGPSTLRWVIRDITERKRAEERLHAFNDRLEGMVANRTEQLENQAIAKDGLLRREKAARMAAEESQSRFRFLAEAAEIMSSSLCYETTLQTVAHMAVPRLANWCFVDIVEEDGSIWRLAVASDDPVAERLGRRMLHRYGAEETQNRMVANAIATGKSEMVTAITEDLLQVIAQDSHHLALLRALAPTSAMVVPLVTRGRTLGAMTFVATTHSPYTPSDIDLAEELAHRAALSVDNARLYRRAQTEIEERERIEERLLRSEGRMRHLFNSGMISIAFFDPSGKITDANDAFLRMMGYGREEMRAGMIGWESLTPPEWRQVTTVEMEELRERGRSEPRERELVTRDGRRFQALVGSAMIDSDEGVAFVLDVTPLKESERQLQARMKQLETIYAITTSVSRERSLDEIYADAVMGLRETLRVDRASVLMFDREGVMRFKHSHGLSARYRHAVEGHSPWGPEERSPSSITIENVAEDREMGEGLRAVVLGEGISALAFIPLVYGERLLGKFMVYYDAPHRFSRDELQVAETIAGHVAFAVGRRRTEEALRASEQRFRSLAESNVIGVMSSSIDGPITWANDEFLRMVGYSREDLASGLLDWRSLTPSGHEELDRRATESLLGTGHCAHHEKEYIRKDGSRVPVLIGLALVTPGGENETIAVVLDMSSRKRAENEMVSAREQAEETNRAKDHFLAILSHELRTPLAPVLAAAQVLDTDEELPPDLRPMVEIILRNAELQGRLIDDMLDLTRIAKGKLKLAMERVNVHDVLGGAIEVCRPEIERKRLRLDLDLRAPVTAVEADPGRLQQVFWNILRNAVKFTPSGGLITIASRNGDGKIMIDIADTGIGIAPGDLGRIFTAFEQGESQGYGHQGGLGLGLSVARALTEQQGGSLEVTSGGSEKGATFTVSFPVVVSAGEKPPETGSTRILLVEDHPDTRRVLDMMLTHKGYDVITASSIEMAMDLAGRERFDILLSDLTLPDGSGLDLVRMVRRIRGIKAIALSGYNAPEDVTRSHQAGFDEHLGKPVDSRRLCATIERLIVST